MGHESRYILKNYFSGLTNTLAKWAAPLALLVILSSMALPSLVKLAHAIYQHQELECSNYSRIHVHKAEFDCSFQKFKNTSPLFFSMAGWNFNVPVIHTVHSFPSYSCISQFKGLPFNLRAPPVIS